MDSFRAVSSLSIVQLMALSALGPAFAETNDVEESHRRSLGRRHAHVVSHSREDYPVIMNWLTSPDSPETSAASSSADENANPSQG